MIRQVVFDIGNVLLDYDRVVQGVPVALTETAADAALVRRAVFESPWWAAMDRGGEVETSRRAMEEELPQRLRPCLEGLFESWDHWFRPLVGTNALARELHGLGVGLYILSNASKRAYRFLKRIPTLELFRGVVLSCDEGLLKPDLELYRRLFDRYDLKPEECFFLDDSPLNVEAGRALGMEGFCFRREMAPLRAALRRAGVEVSLSDPS